MQNDKARFLERTSCISCGSANLIQLSSGCFDDDPLRSLIEKDPWGMSPLPYIAAERWIFVRCAQCSTRFHRRILAPEWIEICYKDWITQEAMQEYLAPQYSPDKHFDEARQRVAHVLRLQKLTEDLRKGSAVRVLDFGCGWGEFLAMCNHFGFEGHGVDFAPDRRKHGKVSIFPGIEELKHELGDSKTSFHAVTLFEVLEHLADPLHVLKSLNELMVPSGVLILETPNCTGVEGIQSARDYDKIDPLNHINAFVPDSLRRIAGNAGFRPIDRGVAQVTCDMKRVIKTEATRILGRFPKRTTQQYFRKI